MIHLTENSIIGEHYNSLTIIDVIGEKFGYPHVLCICICGKTTTTDYYSISHNRKKSCGCKMESHGMSYTKTYESWESMKSRCYREKDASYHNYGGRGIKVCERWLESFENFYEDMGDKPDGYSLDRIDPNGNYEPSNCRWSDWTEQAINRRQKPNKTGHNNIEEILSGGIKKYRTTITRNGCIRRSKYYSDLDYVLSIRDLWKKEYDTNKDSWIENTRLKDYKKMNIIIKK